MDLHVCVSMFMGTLGSADVMVATGRYGETL